MKKLIILAITLFSMNSFATSYCYDRAVSKAYNLQETMSRCETNLPLDAFTNLADKLSSRNPIGYSSRVIKAMAKVQKLVYSDIYRYGVQNDECLNKAMKNYRDLQAEVMQAIIVCR